jgi:hypothetical protein
MRPIFRNSIVAALIVCGSVVTGWSQQEIPPTPEQYLGYQLGARFTPWDRIVDYFRELQQHSDRISVQDFGQTSENRPLVFVTITSAKNRAVLETIRQNVVSLGDPEHTTPARAADIARDTPAVVWLAFGVHGNESSSAEVAMKTASYLLGGSPDAERILDKTIVIIDPLQNPDGHERYVQWFARTRGQAPNPSPDAFEHAEPWPGGRFNHYLIDMNRDWSWSSQQETRARVALYRQWNPQVFVDFHEMSYRSSYFFPPDATPINTNLPKDIERWLEVFGRANAEAFSSKGWPFFVREDFDLFYPGYGDSWPAMHGAIGMTYEVAGHGRAGTAILRPDGVVYTLDDRIQRHYTTALATLQTAAAHREELLLYTAQAMRAQMENGRNTFFVPRDMPNSSALVDMLRRQAIDVRELTAPATVKVTEIATERSQTRTFPVGTPVISTHQPLGGLVQTLMEKTPSFSKGFLEEQRAKVESDEEDEFYDVTSWSLPLAQNVDAYVAVAPGQLSTGPYRPSPAEAFKPGSFGYLVDGSDPDVYRAAGRMLAEGIRFNVSDGEMPLGQRTLARGTLLVFKTNNSPSLDGSLERIGRETGAHLIAIDSGWNGSMAVGSQKVHFVRDPKIALVGGPGTFATSYGMLWFTLDVDTPVPHTNISIETLRTLDLSRYHVLILPDGDYGDRLGKRVIEKLQTWVRSGGTIIAIRGASALLRDKDVDLSKIKPWTAPKKKEKDDADTPPAEERYNEFRVPGAGFRTSMNDRTYLTYGVPHAPVVMIEGSGVLLPVAHKVDNIVTLDHATPLASGFAFPESIDRLKGSVYLVRESVGRGAVITFADEPNYRLFWRGTLPLLLNAAIYSPSFSGGSDE